MPVLTRYLRFVNIESENRNRYDEKQPGEKNNPPLTLKIPEIPSDPFRGFVFPVLWEYIVHSIKRDVSKSNIVVGDIVPDGYGSSCAQLVQIVNEHLAQAQNVVE